MTPRDDEGGGLRGVRLVAATVHGGAVAGVAGWLDGVFWAVCFGSASFFLSWFVTGWLSRAGRRVRDGVERSDEETGYPAQAVVEDAAVIPSRLPADVNHAVATLAVALMAIGREIASGDFRGTAREVWAAFAGNARSERPYTPVSQVGIATRMLGTYVGQRARQWLLDVRRLLVLHSPIDRSDVPVDAVPAASVQFAEVLPMPDPRRTAGPHPPDIGRSSAAAQLRFRLAFGVDLVRYTDRDGPGMEEAQERIAEIVSRTLDRLGLVLDDLDWQPDGDGMKVVIPDSCAWQDAVFGVLDGLRLELAADNAEHADRLRLRCAISSGLIARSRLGYIGDLMIHIHRFLESGQLREAFLGNSEADVVALLSDHVHSCVVKPNWAPLSQADMQPVDIEVKGYKAKVWLWVPRPPSR
ncbi:hypothetical protein ACQP2X_08020 [Actinoplanes sp. CA-131856]